MAGDQDAYRSGGYGDHDRLHRVSGSAGEERQRDHRGDYHDDGAAGQRRGRRTKASGGRVHSGPEAGWRLRASAEVMECIMVRTMELCHTCPALPHFRLRSTHTVLVCTTPGAAPRRWARAVIVWIQN